MAQPAQAAPSSAVIRLGRYETLFRIAAGGMAEVHVARLVGEGGFEKLVAIKRMLPDLAADERFVGMFLDEAKVAANISSPHVVATLDLGRADDDSLYLVMELVVGVSLAALRTALAQQGTPMPVDLGAEVIAQAALGLHDAHEARTSYGEWLGIVHRDVSPQNILLDVSGRVRITDFGVARAIERVTQTQSGEVKGKLAYFAPEQARAKPLDRRADVFALGIVAWELFTGERLFVGDGPADTVMRVLEMPIPRVDEIRPDVPAALADAIGRALDRDVQARTETAGAFADEIRKAVPAAGLARVGELVRERGGQTLRKLEEGIRAQLRSTPARASSPARASASVDPTQTQPAPPEGERAEKDPAPPPEPTAWRRELAVAAAPTVLLPGKAAEPPRRGWLPAAMLVMSLVAVAIGVWVTQTGESTAPTPPAVSHAPPETTTPAPSAPTIAPATVTPVAEPPPASATTASEASPRRSHRPASAEARGDTTPAAPPPTSAPERVAPPAAPTRPEPAATDPEPSGRGTHALRGMDDFESELGE